MHTRPKLDKWIIYGNCLVGYLYDSPLFPHGTRVKTEMIRHVDVPNCEAVCTDGHYRLLEPGTEVDHKSILGNEGDIVGGIRVGDFSKSAKLEEKKIILI